MKILYINLYISYLIFPNMYREYIFPAMWVGGCACFIYFFCF